MEHATTDTPREKRDRRQLRRDGKRRRMIDPALARMERQIRRQIRELDAELARG